MQETKELSNLLVLRILLCLRHSEVKTTKIVRIPKTWNWKSEVKILNFSKIKFY